MRIGLIAVDMDGTLLNLEHRISEANQKALRDAARSGISLAVCSGRMPEEIDDYIADAGLSCWICGMNGCRVLDAPYGTLVEEHRMQTEKALACVDLAMALDLEIYASAGTDSILWRVPADEGGRAWFRKKQEEGRSMRVGEAALREAAATGINKLLMNGDPGPLAELARRVRAMEGADVTSSWETNIEIMPAGVNKGTALAALAARLGIPREAVMAIGDQENDREMIAWAGYGIAMGNALPGIQAVARFVTKDNAHDGVAEAVRRWALGEG